MNCILSGTFGIAMLSASFFTMAVSEEQHKVLRDTFSEDLDRIYEGIVAERRNHYIQGLLLGFLVAYFITNATKVTNRFHKMSIFFGISLTVAVVYYFLMPKSDYMLNHLKTPEQNKAWLHVYKTMKHQYFMGFALGALAAIPLAYALCRN